MTTSSSSLANCHDNSSWFTNRDLTNRASGSANSADSARRTSGRIGSGETEEDDHLPPRLAGRASLPVHSSSLLTLTSLSWMTSTAARPPRLFLDHPPAAAHPQEEPQGRLQDDETAQQGLRLFDILNTALDVDSENDDDSIYFSEPPNRRQRRSNDTRRHQ